MLRCKLSGSFQWSFWKSPIWFLMAHRGTSYEEATRWQGQIGLQYLRRFFPQYVQDVLVGDFDRALGAPVRASFFALKRQESNQQSRSLISRGENLRIGENSKSRKVIFSFTKHVNRGFEYLSQTGVLYAFNLIVLVGAIIGFVVHRTPVYWNLGLMVVLTFSINVFFAGDLPRYRALIFPFAGLFLSNYFRLILLLKARIHFEQKIGCI